MSRLRPLICAFVSLLIVSVGCSGGSGILTAPVGTEVTITTNPPEATDAQPIEFTVVAHNERTVLKSISIDFDDDGTWDDLDTSFDESSITHTFLHTYALPRTYTIRAEVKDANDVAAQATLRLDVAARGPLPVSFDVTGTASPGTPCYATGPPITCAGCLELVGSVHTLRPLGSFAPGSTVNVAQDFKQDPYSTSPPGFTYSCVYHLTLHAEEPTGDVIFGSGTCSTNSITFPPTLTCTVSVSEVVP
jgi:hypothetical protein